MTERTAETYENLAALSTEALDELVFGYLAGPIFGAKEMDENDRANAILGWLELQKSRTKSMICSSSVVRRAWDVQDEALLFAALVDAITNVHSSTDVPVAVLAMRFMRLGLAHICPDFKRVEDQPGGDD